jgi:hypothetical protein
VGGEEECSRSLENAMVKNVEKEERRRATNDEVFQERSGFLKVGGEEECSRSLENAMVKNVEKEERRRATNDDVLMSCVYTHLSHFLQCRQHDNSWTFVFKDHPPEVVHCFGFWS